jgi:hypothetical protein
MHKFMVREPGGEGRSGRLWRGGKYNIKIELHAML